MVQLAQKKVFSQEKIIRIEKQKGQKLMADQLEQSRFE
jgi:hypothetical protein